MIYVLVWKKNILEYFFISVSESGQDEAHTTENTVSENGVEPHIQDASNTPNADQLLSSQATTSEASNVSIIPIKKPDPPKHPELRPGHIWSIKESKEIFRHLKPKIALIKLKHEKKYLRNLLPKELSYEEQEIEELLERAQDSMVMELPSGTSAIVESDGSFTVLPTNYKVS